MRVLIIGGGGREHALAWKIAQDTPGAEVFCAPGNAGTAACATNVPLSAEDVDGLTAWARANAPDLTIVGPEAPLCAGLVDRLDAEGLTAFGPRKDAARLEGSKSFAKDVMELAGVPTAASRTFSEADKARAYVRERGAPIVVKADGLAAGKGVMVCQTVAEAEDAVAEVLENRAFGDAGANVLIEDFLTGEEASILALVDGKNIALLASSQDHKPVFDGDAGPNTGGMGAYSPAPVVEESLWPVIREQVFERTVRELRRRGITFKGVMYAGLMMTDQGPKVLEFNTRFGDPECQAILPRWDGDLVPVLQACADGRLSQDMIRWKPDACVCVVMASGGYPGRYEKGKVISGLDKANAMGNVQVFHAGTALDEEGRTLTSGGRVLGVTALGGDLAGAIDRAYKAVSEIRFDGAHARKDIGAKALERLAGKH
jgi:phosphoribosylamine--glycine ligase